MSIEWTARTALANRLFDHERLARTADGLAIALAISLPWSTSATSILAALWLIALIPTLDPAALRRVLSTLAGGLPVLLWALGLAGVLWSDAPLIERFDALGAFHKLLCIPLLMAQFERSNRASWLMTGFLVSCGLLLILSFALALFPGIPWRQTPMRGVPVKNYASQSELFTICAFLLAELARQRWQEARRAAACGFAAAALAFLINIHVIATTRTVLVVLPVLFVLLGFRWLRWRGVAAAVAVALAFNAAAWVASPFFHVRVGTLVPEVADYKAANQRSSAGERLEFWKKSLVFIAQAPVIGHGTGSITEQFRRAAVGESGASAVVSSNPHNQTFAVAIQLGLVGAAVLFALWGAHLWVFRGTALAAWVGFVIVVQNIVGSLFNSQLFDFTHGWAYVIGVGVCAGVTLGRSDATAPGVFR
jgi:O-antigen ligase